MSFIQRELDRLQGALNSGQDSPKREEYYAAIQALSWALEPNGFASPYNMISGETGENPVDCPLKPLEAA